MPWGWGEERPSLGVWSLPPIVSWRRSVALIRAVTFAAMNSGAWRRLDPGGRHSPPETPHREGHLSRAQPSERLDELPVFAVGEDARRLGPDVSLRSQGQRQLRRRLVVRELADDDGVVCSEGEVPLLELAAGTLERHLGGVQTPRALADVLEPLLGEGKQADIGRHGSSWPRRRRRDHRGRWVEQGVV